MQKAVIFDMDGVLVDSQPFHFAVDYSVLIENGASVLPEDTHKYAGMATADRWGKYRKDFHLKASVQELIKTHCKTIMNNLDNASLEPIDGVIDLLRNLKDNHVALAVASSSSREFITKMLDKLKIKNFFPIIISGEDMKNSKPAPDIFIFAAEKLGIKRENCIVIEDSQNGVIAAKAAGIKCVGYVNKSSGEQDISAADIIIERFSDFDLKWI